MFPRVEGFKCVRARLMSDDELSFYIYIYIVAVALAADGSRVLMIITSLFLMK